MAAAQLESGLEVVAAEQGVASRPLLAAYELLAALDKPCAALNIERGPPRPAGILKKQLLPDSKIPFIMAAKNTSLKDRGLPPLKPLVIMVVILIPVGCSAIMVNCSQPNQPALLEALNPIFNLSAIRPVTNMSTQTNITLFFILYGVLGVDEKAQLLTTYIWLHFWWQNEFVSWDPVQCGTDKISLPRHKFWVPDIVINEFMDENTAPHVPYVYLHSDGKVHDAKPAKVVSSCNLDIYTFPFDIQNCTLTFNSYIHFGERLF
ncbi:5-hydroxytryptamine receptor 3A-like [Aulostomus maculatus]